MWSYRSSVPAADTLTLDGLRVFLDQGHLAPPGDLPTVAGHVARLWGWTARLYVVDFQQYVLVPLPANGLEPADLVPIDGTLAGRAFRRVEQVLTTTTPLTLWTPLLDGVHRFGVIQYELPDDTDAADPTFQDRVRLLSHAIGHMLAAKLPYGDALTAVSRRRHRTVATELLDGLLPPLTFASPGVVLSAILEPCYDVAADAFDYAVIGHTLHFAIFDAIGHDMRGTLIAATAMAAYRNARREGLSLPAAVQWIDKTLAEQSGDSDFVTAVLAELDLPTGRLRYVNAGHPAPLLMRRGKVVKHLEGARRIVLGLGQEEPSVAEEWLERDDRIVLYTDGITEARDDSGAFYGLPRLVDQLQRSTASDEPAPETLRQVIHAVLDHQDNQLQDDATLLIAHWAGAEEHRMDATPRT